MTKIKRTTTKLTKLLSLIMLLAAASVWVMSDANILGTIIATNATFDYVNGRNITADGANLDTLYTTIGLSSLTSSEVDQLENIGASTISSTQWGYLAAFNQGLTTTSAPTFATLNTGQGAYELYAMNQDVESTDAVTFATVNTGQGAYELYAMNQDVESTDAVTFATVDTGQGANELYDMNQNVLTTSDVTFNSVSANIDGSNITSGTISSSRIQDAYLLNTGDTATGTIIIDQDGSGAAITIDSEANNYVLSSINGKQTSNPALFMNSDQAFTGTGDSSFVGFRLNSGSSTGNLMNLRNDGTGASLNIDQNGDGIGLYIDSEASTSSNFGLIIDTSQGATAFKASSESSSNQVQLVRANSDTTASNWFYRDLASAVTASPVMFIEQDNSGDDQPALSIQQDAPTAPSIQLTQNGHTCNIIVDADGTCNSGTAMVVDNSIAICAVCS